MQWYPEEVITGFGLLDLDGAIFAQKAQSTVYQPAPEARYCSQIINYIPVYCP